MEQHPLKVLTETIQYFLLLQQPVVVVAVTTPGQPELMVLLVDLAVAGVLLEALVDLALLVKVTLEEALLAVAAVAAVVLPQQEQTGQLVLAVLVALVQQIQFQALLQLMQAVAAVAFTTAEPVALVALAAAGLVATMRLALALPVHQEPPILALVEVAQQTEVASERVVMVDLAW